MIKTDLIKEQSIYFTKNLLIISVFLILLNVLINKTSPYMKGYKDNLLNIFNFIVSNLSIFIITLGISTILLYSFKSILKKIRFLFSEETTDSDIYEESLVAWKEKKYDLVYENMNYIYEMSQKENIHNAYTETAKAILLFQKTDFSQDVLSKEEILPTINAFINTYSYKELNLNTVHLAYSFLHLLTLEKDINKKAIYHLICGFLFSRVDPVYYKNRIEIEIRIYNSYLEQNKDSILSLIPDEIFETVTNYHSNISEDQYRTRIIPFLSKII